MEESKKKFGPSLRASYDGPAPNIRRTNAKPWYFQSVIIEYQIQGKLNLVLVLAHAPIDQSIEAKITLHY